MAVTLTKSENVPLPQRKYHQATVDRLFEKICRETGGSVGINKIATVAFHYGTAALNPGKKHFEKHTKGQDRL